MDVNVSYKRVIYTQVLQLLLCLLFLKNKQFKIILMPRRYIVGSKVTAMLDGFCIIPI